MFRVALSALVAVAALACGPARAADDEPWKNPSTALVIDAYELNTIDWAKLVEASPGDDEAADMLREMAGKADDLADEFRS